MNRNIFCTSTVPEKWRSEFFSIVLKGTYERIRIEESRNINKRTTLKKERNKILKEIKQLVKKDINEKLIKDIEAIEESKDDSHRMYNAVKII